MTSEVKDRGSYDNSKYINSPTNRETQNVIITTKVKTTTHIVYRLQLSKKELGRQQRRHTNGYDTVRGKIIGLSSGENTRYRFVAFEIFAIKYQGTNAT